MGKFLDKLIDSLAKDGEKIIKKAYETKTYKDRTYNLHDSYGSAVYYKGVLLPNTIYYTTPNATKTKKWYGSLIKGHSELIDFLQEYEGGSGLELVVVAAMPYASILENQEGRVRQKYKVISGVTLDMNNLTLQKYKGSSVRRFQTSRK